MQANLSAVTREDMRLLYTLVSCLTDVSLITISFSCSPTLCIAGQRKPGSTDARAPFGEVVAVKVPMSQVKCISPDLHVEGVQKTSSRG